MKSRLVVVLSPVIFLIVCCLGACNSASEEEIVGDAETVAKLSNENKLAQSFVADSLSRDQLHVFQQRGQQKLDDFISYTAIVSNKAYNKEMRFAAKEQMMQLFTDSTVMIEAGVSEAQEKARPLFEFAEEVYTSQYDSVKIKVLYAKAKEPEPKNTGSYEGSVTADVSIKRYLAGKDVFSTTATFTAATVVQQVQKQFGNDSSRVWTVMLGEIKQLSVALQ
ncbi:MAG: hypothetical protein WAQ28_14595 [Bacteroidia bacterium]